MNKNHQSEGIQAHSDRMRRPLLFRGWGGGSSECPTSRISRFGCPSILKQNQDRPRLANILVMGLTQRFSQLDGGTLTPSLCASFLTTPFCGDRMTVSIFIDSMLWRVHVSNSSPSSTQTEKLTPRAVCPSPPPGPRQPRSSRSCMAWVPQRCRPPP